MPELASFYAVERSLDSYKFNLLHNKQLFINQLKTNTLAPPEEEEEHIQKEDVNTEKTEDSTIHKTKIESTLDSPQSVYNQYDKHTSTNEETQVSNHIGMRPKI